MHSIVYNGHGSACVFFILLVTVDMTEGILCLHNLAFLGAMNEKI